MRVKRGRGIVSPITLREVYHTQGDFSAKMIIDPRESPSIETVDVDMRNSDGRPMVFTARRWGTKLTISFKVDRDTPDGVSVIDVRMLGKDGKSKAERFDIWIIKD